MADLKPIGSEKLEGQEKIKRILEIARYKEIAPKNINESSSTEYSITMSDGNDYQIVKEKSGYVIKKTISESETDYIEPIKNRKYYNSYSQAFKRLNLMAKEINNITGNEEGVSLFGEQKKFVLKTPKSEEPMAPAPEVPAEPPAVPTPELPPSDLDVSPEVSSEEESVTPDLEGDLGSEETAEPVDNGGVATYKTIQKLTGKLTQKIREYDEVKGLTSEEIKYVINMVLSSLKLDNLSNEDKEDVLSKFESEDVDLGDEEMGSEEDITSDSEVEDVQSDMDIPVESEFTEDDRGALIDSIFGESKVDKVLSKYFEYTDEEKKKISESNKKSLISKLNSVNKLTETVEQKLASEKFLQENQDYKFIGLTNKKNLIFQKEGKQVKITPEGLVI